MLLLLHAFPTAGHIFRDLTPPPAVRLRPDPRVAEAMSAQLSGMAAGHGTGDAGAPTLPCHLV
ncbi:hypothetical protein GCM10017643_28530 [Ancylobacter dichloromethanicus]|uniref:Uncharacterized protein n=1 Tax=Ancylobacter dichloromethanicus TaxID=518825 RepID=A0A9W6J8K0_9HYPH|nr:hypothetical protein GCM10017643_28530 [Ancylobacter dichloromethanicus]